MPFNNVTFGRTWVDTVIPLPWWWWWHFLNSTSSTLSRIDWEKWGWIFWFLNWPSWLEIILLLQGTCASTCISTICNKGYHTFPLYSTSIPVRQWWGFLASKKGMWILDLFMPLLPQLVAPHTCVCNFGPIITCKEFNNPDHTPPNDSSLLSMMLTHLRLSWHPFERLNSPEAHCHCSLSSLSFWLRRCKCFNFHFFLVWKSTCRKPLEAVRKSLNGCACKVQLADCGSQHTISTVCVGKCWIHPFLNYYCMSVLKIPSSFISFTFMRMEVLPSL